MSPSSIDYGQCRYPQLIEGCRIEAQMCAEMGNNLQRLIPAVQQHDDGLDFLNNMVCNLFNIAHNLTSLAAFNAFAGTSNYFRDTIVSRILRELLPSMRQVLTAMHAHWRSSPADDTRKWRLIFHDSTPSRHLKLPHQLTVYSRILIILVQHIRAGSLPPDDFRDYTHMAMHRLETSSNERILEYRPMSMATTIPPFVQMQMPQQAFTDFPRMYAQTQTPFPLPVPIMTLGTYMVPVPVYVPAPVPNIAPIPVPGPVPGPAPVSVMRNPPRIHPRETARAHSRVSEPHNTRTPQNNPRKHWASVVLSATPGVRASGHHIRGVDTAAFPGSSQVSLGDEPYIAPQSHPIAQKIFRQEPELSLSIFLDPVRKVPVLQFLNAAPAKPDEPAVTTRYLHALKIDRLKYTCNNEHRYTTTLHLVHCSHTGGTPQPWVALNFESGEELVLMWLTFQALKCRYSPPNHMEPGAVFVPNEISLFECQILEGQARYLLTVQQEKTTQTRRFCATYIDGHYPGCVVWTAFIPHLDDERKWFTTLTNNRIAILHMEVHIFSDTYDQNSRRSECEDFKIHFASSGSFTKFCTRFSRRPLTPPDSISNSSRGY